MSLRTHKRNSAHSLLPQLLEPLPLSYTTRPIGYLPFGLSRPPVLRCPIGNTTLGFCLTLPLFHLRAPCISALSPLATSIAVNRDPRSIHVDRASRPRLSHSIGPRALFFFSSQLPRACQHQQVAMADRQLSSASSSRRQKQPTDGAVGQFVIDKEIGKGSFAQVYSGRHKVRTPHFFCAS